MSCGLLTFSLVGADGVEDLPLAETANCGTCLAKTAPVGGAPGCFGENFSPMTPAPPTASGSTAWAAPRAESTTTFKPSGVRLDGDVDVSRTMKRPLTSSIRMAKLMSRPVRRGLLDALDFEDQAVVLKPDGVVELQAVAAEDLDAVFLHRVVGGVDYGNSVGPQR